MAPATEWDWRCAIWENHFRSSDSRLLYIPTTKDEIEEERRAAREVARDLDLGLLRTNWSHKKFRGEPRHKDDQLYIRVTVSQLPHEMRPLGPDPSMKRLDAALRASLAKRQSRG